MKLHYKTIANVRCEPVSLVVSGTTTAQKKCASSSDGEQESKERRGKDVKKDDLNPSLRQKYSQSFVEA